MNAIATVKSDGLNVRSRAYQDASIIDVLTKGDKVPVLERRHFDGGYVWLKVKLDSGKEGWVDARFVSVTSQVPDEEPPYIPVPDVPNELPRYLKAAVMVAVIFIVAGILTRCIGL